MICQLRVAYKNEFEGKAQLRRHLRERFTMVEKASGDQQAMTKAHEVEVNGELEMEHKAKVEAKLVLEMSIVKVKQIQCREAELMEDAYVEALQQTRDENESELPKIHATFQYIYELKYSEGYDRGYIGWDAHGIMVEDEILKLESSDDTRSGSHPGKIQKSAHLPVLTL
ncbi:hypothetical protein D8674_000097 [Pyrus ussuriensis x Pyrus communis]|uniref:Uncharacterized protein n=1 Tax=Pyrus ussuriensis x Pyrus communis TaxID=2448454 RepID=A0A5N5F2H5_9ROSA|nr:hypothetical protein D8674_000097 [Pyrus ussuriensis x Pyrus communis]